MTDPKESSMDRFCVKCGTQLQPGSNFCENCGTAWTAAADPLPIVTSTPVGAAPVVVVQPPEKRKSSAPLLITAFVILALAIVGWLYIRGRAINTRTTAPLAVSSSTAQTMTASTTTVTSTTLTPAATTAAPVAAADVAATTVAAVASKACSPLTPEEMGAILGMKVVKVTTEKQICHYFTNDDNSADVETTWEGGKAAFDQTKGFNSAPGLFEPVAGIGDEADFQAAGILHVLKGDTYFVVGTRAYPNELETESAIARKIMEKMK